MLEEYVICEWWASYGRDSTMRIIFYPDSTFSFINNSPIPFFVKQGAHKGIYYLQVDTKFNDVYIDFLRKNEV